MIAIAAHRLIFFLRLALVAALAGYTLPSVSFAMHGDLAATYVDQAAQAVARDAHSHHDAGAVHDHGDQTADHHQKIAKQDCCSNSCLNLALIGEAPQLRVAGACFARGYGNDERAFAEPIRLNRPPSIGA